MRLSPIMVDMQEGQAPSKEQPKTIAAEAAETQKKAIHLQLYLMIFFIVLFAFAIYVAISNITLGGLTGFSVLDFKDRNSHLSITPQDETLVLKYDNVKQCCLFSTEDGPKRCAVVGTQDCSECTPYCKVR